MYENIVRAVDAIENGITLKSDYSEELEQLDSLEADISVLRHLGTPVWKCCDLADRIKRMKTWIHEEEAAR